MEHALLDFLLALGEGSEILQVLVIKLELFKPCLGRVKPSSSQDARGVELNCLSLEWLTAALLLLFMLDLGK